MSSFIVVSETQGIWLSSIKQCISFQLQKPIVEDRPPVSSVSGRGGGAGARESRGACGRVRGGRRGDTPRQGDTPNVSPCLERMRH